MAVAVTVISAMAQGTSMSLMFVMSDVSYRNCFIGCIAGRSFSNHRNEPKAFKTKGEGFAAGIGCPIVLRGSNV